MVVKWSYVFNQNLQKGRVRRKNQRIVCLIRFYRKLLHNLFLRIVWHRREVAFYINFRECAPPLSVSQSCYWMARLVKICRTVWKLVPQDETLCVASARINEDGSILYCKDGDSNDDACMNMNVRYVLVSVGSVDAAIRRHLLPLQNLQTYHWQRSCYAIPLQGRAKT